MSIYQTAHYQVRPEAVDTVTAAIVEFVDYVAKEEPGSRMYAAWQQKDDPTKFVHLFEFADEAARETYGPELVGGPVVFTDFVVIAANTSL